MPKRGSSVVAYDQVRISQHHSYTVECLTCEKTVAEMSTFAEAKIAKVAHVSAHQKERKPDNGNDG